MSSLLLVVKTVSDKAAASKCGKISVFFDDELVIDGAPAHTLNLAPQMGTLDEILDTTHRDSIDEYGSSALRFGEVGVYSGHLGKDGRIRPAHSGDVRVSPSDFAHILDLVRRDPARISIQISKPFFLFGKTSVSDSPAKKVPFHKAPTRENMGGNDAQVLRKSRFRKVTSRNGIHEDDSLSVSDVMFINSFPDVAPIYRPDSFYSWYVWFSRNKDSFSHGEQGIPVPVGGYEGMTMDIHEHGVGLFDPDGKPVGSVLMMSDDRMELRGSDGVTTSIEFEGKTVYGNMYDAAGASLASFEGKTGDEYDMSGSWKFTPKEGLHADGALSFDGESTSLDAFEPPASIQEETVSRTPSSNEILAERADSLEHPLSFYDGGFKNSSNEEFLVDSNHEQEYHSSNNAFETSRESIESPAETNFSTPDFSSGSDPYDRS